MDDTKKRVTKHYPDLDINFLDEEDHVEYAPDPRANENVENASCSFCNFIQMLGLSIHKYEYLSRELSSVLKDLRILSMLDR